jgi:hypothetical protein
MAMNKTLGRVVSATVTLPHISHKTTVNNRNIPDFLNSSVDPHTVCHLCHHGATWRAVNTRSRHNSPDSLFNITGLDSSGNGPERATTTDPEKNLSREALGVVFF